VKKITVFLVCITFFITAFSQSVYEMIPFSVFANAYADTMLVTKAVLIKAGISSYSFDATSWKDGFNSKTIYVNKEGNITAARYCLFKKDSGIKFCTYDTIIYDVKGRMIEQRMYDGQNELETKIKADYPNGKEIKYTWMPRFYSDTPVSIARFNSDGKIIEVAHKRKDADTAYSRFYYNSKGLLDSTKDAYTPRTFVFKRKEKKGEQIVEISTGYGYKTTFIYNNAGRLIKNFAEERYHEYDNAPLNQVTDYYYNADGTLSKIVRREKYTPNIKKPQTMTIYYSYTKY
jgi:hypothetical protein